MKLLCTYCHTESALTIIGQDAIHDEEGLKHYAVFDSDAFTFGFRDYDRTLVITCKTCGKKVNINNTRGDTEAN